MYAIIEDSGRQLRVTEGDVLDVDLRDLAEGAKEVAFDRVLLVSEQGQVKVGTPLVKGAKVVAEIVDRRSRARRSTSTSSAAARATGARPATAKSILRVRVTKIVA